jgi:hypothetical protein
VTIGTDAFEDLLKLEAEQRGMAALTYLLIEHPLGGIRPDKVREKARASADALEAALLGRR